MHYASFVLFLTKNPVTQCLVSVLQTRTPRLTKVKHHARSHKSAHLTSEPKSMLWPRDSHPGYTTISSRFLKTAMTPPHCPEGFNKFHWQNFFFSTTFVQNIGKPHTSSVSLWRARSDNISLVLVGEQCKNSKVHLLLQKRPHRVTSMQDTIQFQNCRDQQLRVPDAPLSSAISQPQNTAPSRSPPAAVYTRFIYTTTASFVFWPRDKKTTVDWDATVGKEISNLLQKSGSAFFHYKLNKLYPLPRCSKISD